MCCTAAQPSRTKASSTLRAGPPRERLIEENVGCESEWKLEWKWRSVWVRMSGRGGVIADWESCRQEDEIL